MTARVCIMVVGTILGLTVGVSAQSKPRPIGLPDMDSSNPVFGINTQLPPFSAELPKIGEVFIVPSLSIHQNFINGNELTNPNDSAAKVYDWRLQADYETFSLRLPFLVGLTEQLAIGASFKLEYYYGGFMDEFIRHWHSTFGFPSNNRDTYNEYLVHIAIATTDGQQFTADQPFWYFHDPLLYMGYRFIKEPIIDLTGFAYISIPWWHADQFDGRQALQLAVSLNAAFTPTPGLEVQSTVGIVIPTVAFGNYFKSKPQPMICARLTTTIELSQTIGAFLGFNFQTSPATGYMLRENDYNFFTGPLLDFHFGLSFNLAKDADGSFTAITIQEDPFFHNSDDISFYLSGAYRW